MGTERLRQMLAAAVAAAALLASGGPAQARPAPEEYAGINIQKLIFELPPQLWFTHFDAMQRAGIKLVRFDALWQAAEPNPPRDGVHTYNWNRFDFIVGELAKRGIRWLPAVEYSAKWAATTTEHYAAPPRDAAEYGRFAGAVATRYGAGGSFWREHPAIPALPVRDFEIWNAPNNTAHYYPRPDPAHYADMYLAARSAIKAVDPEADAWVGGLAGVDAIEFVGRMYAARRKLRGNVDAVGIHPYGFDADASARMVIDLRATLDALGEASAGIPVTEIGWYTRGAGSGRRISDGMRATYMAALTERLARSDCGVWTFMPHTWATRERDGADAEEWFGLWGAQDAVPNATGRAYADTVPRVSRPRRPDVPLCDRPLAVEVVRASTATARTVRRRSSRSGRTTRVRRYRRTCHTASVRVGPGAMEGATVTFEYLATRRGSSRRTRRLVRRRTGETGTASVCRTRRAGRRSRRPLTLIRVEASHPDVAHVAATVRRLRLP